MKHVRIINITCLNLWAFLFLMVFSFAGCKTKTISGVYAGVEVKPKVNAGGGMDSKRNDITLLLRPDGSFTDDLSDSTWQTNKQGTYTVEGNNVVLKYKDPGDYTETYVSDKNTLTNGGTTLNKMEVSNNIPAGNYEFTHAVGGGGISGVTYVGTSGSKSFNFDGNGRFSTDGYTTVSISGDNIGGGSVATDPAKSGTYSLDNGNLTLIFTNKQHEKHSFFVSDEAAAMAVIDGQIFFKDENKTDKPLPTTAMMVQAIKKKQGGKAIDEMQSYVMNYTIDELTVIDLRNFTNNTERIQIYKDNKLMQGIQYNGTDSWQWNAGKTQPLSAASERNMKYNFYTGISAFKANSIAELLKGKVTRAEDGLCLNYTKDGIDFKIIVDEAYKIIGEYNSISGKISHSEYSDHKIINAILFPMQEESTTGDKTSYVSYTKILVNDPAYFNWPPVEGMN